MSEKRESRTPEITVEEINACVGLTERHREVLLLARLFPYPEIATTLEISLGTVKSRLNRARTKFALLTQNKEDSN